jgi:hypothetical protein
VEEIPKIIEKNGQTEIDFSSINKLERTEKEVINKYPELEKVIKGRITYDGKFFIINTEKMTEEEFWLTMEKANQSELNRLFQEREKKRQEEKEDDLSYITPKTKEESPDKTTIPQINPYL